MNNKQNGNRPKSTFQRYLPYIFLGIIVICFISVFSYTVNHKLDLNGDNATYIQLARNMAEGHGYTTLNLEGEYVPASHFPPGYSALLSFFMRIGIDSLMAFKILNGIFLGLGIIILYFITWKVTKQLYLAFSIAILSVLAPSTLHFAGMVMSEMSYMLATVLAILSLFLYDRQMAKKTRPGIKIQPSVSLLQIPVFLHSYPIRRCGILHPFHWKQHLICHPCIFLVQKRMESRHRIRGGHRGLPFTVDHP